jgi:hypothetical protein
MLRGSTGPTRSTSTKPADGEEERMIRDAARGFAQGVLQPRVIEAFATKPTRPSCSR